MAKKVRQLVAGVPVDPVTFEEALAAASGFLKDGGQHLIVTPNPEMAVLAFKDDAFARLLKSSDLAIADGFGLKVAAWIQKKRVPEIVTGVDFSLGLAGLCEQERCSVYLLGSEEGIAERAAERLRHAFPNLNVAGAESGGVIRYRDGGWRQDEEVMEKIRRSKPDVLLVALGHGKQERWIRDHLQALPSVKIAVGVGGTFDYLSGKARRPPGSVRGLHLEWLWRLGREPKRLGRILNAVVVFILIVLLLRLRRVKS
jgi:N-acetylglucosaminyldiphosphoundecaprenol N-acetyl-beta-D-mannosaminyltransferase